MGSRCCSGVSQIPHSYEFALSAWLEVGRDGTFLKTKLAAESTFNRAIVLCLGAERDLSRNTGPSWRARIAQEIRGQKPHRSPGEESWAHPTNGSHDKNCVKTTKSKASFPLTMVQVCIARERLKKTGHRSKHLDISPFMSQMSTFRLSTASLPGMLESSSLKRVWSHVDSPPVVSGEG